MCVCVVCVNGNSKTKNRRKYKFDISARCLYKLQNKVLIKSSLPKVLIY